MIKIRQNGVPIHLHLLLHGLCMLFYKHELPGVFNCYIKQYTKSIQLIIECSMNGRTSAYCLVCKHL